MDDVSTIELPPDLVDIPVTDFADVVKARSLSDEEREAVTAVPDLINEQPQSTLLARVEAQIAADKATPPPQTGANQALRRQALRVWWYFAQGIDAGGARRYEDGVRFFRRAAYGFARLGNQEQLEDSVFSAVYNEAGLLTQQQKFPEAQEKFTKLRNIIESSSRMGTEQREMLASLEFEIMMQQAGQDGRSGKPIQAEQLLRRLAERAQGIAAGHDEDDPAYKLWAGNAGMLRAQAALANGIGTISLYNFDHVAEGESAAAEKAAQLLERVSPPNAAMTKFYSQMLGVVEELAKIMLRIFSLSFHSDKGELRTLRGRVSAAREVIPAAAGADSLLLAQTCDQMDQWLSNLQRLAKPSKKDLGIYGGLVTCVTFCLLLLVIAVVNKAFKLGATATAVFSTCTPLALVAGFGLAGLRAWRSGRSTDPATQPAPKG